MIYFITSNKDKFIYAHKELAQYGIELVQKTLPIIEIQSENPIDITLDKANKAYQLVNSPILITDSSWSIPALNGFPGPYLHDINNWFTPDDFINLMSKKTDKSIIFHYIAVYKTGDICKTFDITLQGRFLTKAFNGEGTSLDRLVTFRDDQRTLAECAVSGGNFYPMPEHPLWKKVGTWLKKNS